MDTHRSPALCVDMDVDAVEGVGVHGRHDEAWIVGTDRDETEVKGPAMAAYLCKGRTVGEVVGGVVIVDVLGKLGDGPVT